MIGYSTCVTVAGFVFGMRGWLIVSTATVIGSGDGGDGVVGGDLGGEGAGGVGVGGHGGGGGSLLFSGAAGGRVNGSEVSGGVARGDSARRMDEALGCCRTAYQCRILLKRWEPSQGAQLVRRC